jgi:uncharacterized RDD family membrane protein YckC
MMAGGYLSEDAKRNYTVLVGVLALLALGAQFVLPMFTMLAFMPSFLTMGTSGLRERAFARGAVAGDALWYPERTILVPPGEGKASTRLGRIVLRPGAQPEVVASELPDDAVLLADGTTIWVLSEQGVSTYIGGQLRGIPIEGDHAPLTSPFLLEGRPAGVVPRPTGYAIVVLDGHVWKERVSIPSPSAEGDGAAMRAVAASGVVHLFLRTRGQIFRKAATEPSVPIDDSWVPVTRAEAGWGAFAHGGAPAVYTLPKEGVAGQIRVLRPSGSEWQETFKQPAPAFAVSTAVFPSEAPDALYLASSGAFGNARVVLQRDGNVVRDIRIGESAFPDFFGGVFVAVFGGIVAVGFGFAIVLSFLMPRFRRTEHIVDGTSVSYAPVWRRAVAEMIDGTLICGPLVWSYLGMFTGLGELDSSFTPESMLARMGLVFLSLGWGGIGFLVYSFTEGRWGVTLGKYLLGIRTVGTDLRPCGFGRAFLRNLLLIVDGFFYFLVGLILVALTEQWQRLGDLAARTIVVRAGPHTQRSTRSP